MVKYPWLPRHQMGRVVIISALLFILLVLWLPISETFYWSLFVREPGFQQFTGLDNYQKILFDDPTFWKSLGVTANFALLAVPGVVILGLFLAITVNNIRNLTVRGIFTASFFSAYVVPLVAVALVWRYIYLPGRQGLLNIVLGWFELGPIRWLNSAEWALRSLVILRIWKEAGYAMVLFLAGLQAIPSTYYDAAKVDGAGFWQRLWHITLPLLMPAIVVVTVLNILYGLRVFDIVYALTNGGPGYATEVLSTEIFKAFSKGQYGLGTALSSILFVILVVAGYFVIRLLERREPAQK